MKIEKVCRDPLSRQVSEAVLIRRSKGETLNGKMEFNQPRLFNMRRELQIGWKGLTAIHFLKTKTKESTFFHKFNAFLVFWWGPGAKDLKFCFLNAI